MQETEAKEAEIFDAVQNVYHIWDASLFDPWGHCNFFINMFTNNGAIEVHQYLQRENKNFEV